MTEQSNAELIAEALAEWKKAEMEGLLPWKRGRKLRDALKAAEQENAELVRERNEYAAAVEKMRKAINGPHPANSGLDSYTLSHLSPLLDAAPADALREVKAEAWDEGATAASEGYDLPDAAQIHNPYRKGQS